MHQPGRHLERFTGKGHATQRIGRVLLAQHIAIEIGARFVGHHHGFEIEAVDQASMQTTIKGGGVSHQG